MGKKVRILCLDGGGIRGIIPATVMQYLEEKLIEFSENNDARIADYFDMIVGTSTGGILACYYLFPNPERHLPNTPNSKYTAREALEFYIHKGKFIFDDSKKKSWFGIRQLFNATRFSSDNIESIFNEQFGEVMYNELLQRCIVTAYNLQTQKSIFFNNREKRQKAQVRKFKIKDVARSTSAAPTYFSPAKIINYANNSEMVNIDGGVFGNNPTMCAYAEARTTYFESVAITHPSAKDMMILSIGTGSSNMELKNVSKSGDWGVINWAKSIPDIMMDGGLDTVNYQVNLLFDTLTGEDKKNYKRVDVPESLRNAYYNSDMSDASKENIDKLQSAGKKTIANANKTKPNEHTLDEFIRKLVEINRLIKEDEASLPSSPSTV